MPSAADMITEALVPPPGSEASNDLYAAARAKLMGQAPGAASDIFRDVPSYAVEYHCQRFVMGNTVSMGDDGRKEFIPTDDDEELAKIMRLKWDGKAMIINRLDTFLQDGTVVVWLEWLTPKEKKEDPRPAHARTVGELMNPKVPPASAGEIPPEAKEPPSKVAQGSDVLSPPDDGKFLGITGPSYENEPDF